MLFWHLLLLIGQEQGDKKITATMKTQKDHLAPHYTAIFRYVQIELP